jgi:hypothetical protein
VARLIAAPRSLRLTCPAGSQRLPGLALPFLPAGLQQGRIGAALAPVDRGARGPQREGLCTATGRGAQVPALEQADAQVKPVAGPHREAELFPQVRHGVAGPARPQVHVHDPDQQECLVPEVARVPGLGQARRRPDARGFGQVPGTG